jgi:proteasome accessory factor B
VPTVSRKSERLVNLTIALLATKRYLTKSEIFRTLEGYEGATETKERMFERDKDDLRKLGIEIEVGSFDPLFEDEPGYRIKPESYALQIKNLSQVDIALLSIAAGAWQGAALDSPALSALLKLQSIGIDSDLDALPALQPRIPNTETDISVLIEAIASKIEVHFQYLGSSLEVSSRKVNPYAVASSDGAWYLVGFDLEKQSIRTFKTTRMLGEVVLAKTSKQYEIPSNFALEKHLVPERDVKNAIIYARNGKANSLRASSTTLSSDGDWELLSCTYGDEETFVASILWHGLDVIVQEPLHLRDKVITSLQKLVSLHG